MAKSKRKNLTFLTMLISFIVMFVFRVLLTHISGSKGVTYFSVPNELFFLFAGMFSFGIEEAIGAMIEGRMSKQQYANANKVSTVGILYAFTLGIVISIVLVLIKNTLIEKVFGLHLSGLSFMIMLPAIPLFIMCGALRGFFKGTGVTYVTIQSQLIFAVSYVVAGSIGSYGLQNYGQKVSNLLRQEEFASSYGAMGASIGILVASFITIIHIAIMYILMKRRTVYSGGRDYSKTLDSSSNIVLSIIGTSLIPTLFWAAICMVPFINMILLFKNKSAEFSMEYTFGEYYGKTFPIAGIAVLIIAIFTYPFIRKAISAIRREEYRISREKLNRMIHRIASLTFFFAAMIMVLSDNILGVLFDVNGEKTTLFLQLQAICIIFAVCSTVFLEMIINMQNYSMALIIAAIGLAAHVVFAVIFIASSKMSITGLILSNLIFYVVVTVISFIYISRVFQYTQEWFRTIIVTLIAAIISSLLGMLLNKAISPLIGNGISMLIVIVVSMIVYIVILLALKGYSEDELEGSPFGRVVLSIGRMFNLL